MLGKDFKEFIASLSARGVEYLVIGGYAVAYHGFPRYTKDLDIWIGPSASNVARLLKAMEDFGFGSLGLTAADFQDPTTVIQLGHPPYRIDLLCGVGGLDFSKAYARREQVVLGDLTVSFIAREDLVAAKRLAGRHQDLADVENLTSGGTASTPPPPKARCRRAPRKA
ncbi:MAG: nucleotidyltransferase [Kiritimatiellae bacterium]|nr:nucleotidyltransferase [Kiritimatiellia bacterium]